MVADEPEPPPVKARRLSDARVVRLLTRTQFGSYLLGSSVSQTGTWIHRVAMMLLIWEITQSALWLGLFAMADLLPIVIFGPLAGAAADRWDRLTLTKLTQWAQLAIALALGVLTLLGLVNLTWLMTLAVAQGCAIAVNQPARMTLIHSLAGREDLGSAVALGSVSINVTRLIGPAIAGLLLLEIDVAWLFFLNVLLTAVFIFVLQRLRIAAPTSAGAQGGMWEMLRQGLHFAVTDRQIRILLILLFVGGGGVRSMLELFTVFADAKFDSTASGLAVLTSAMAAGSTCAGLYLGVFSRTEGMERRISIAWAVCSVSMALLAWVTQPILILATAAVSGFFATTCVINTQTYVQLATPDALRGRVLSVHGVVLRASPALGALVAGYAIDHFGLLGPVAISCTVSFITAVVAFAIQGRTN